jgi:hypothetical protein
MGGSFKSTYEAPDCAKLDCSQAHQAEPNQTPHRQILKCKQSPTFLKKH